MDEDTQDLSFNISQNDALFAQAGTRYFSSDAVADLTQAWIDERSAPELLPYKRFLVESLIDQLEDQIEKFALELLRKPNFDQIMSRQEIDYARRYQELIEEHNHESFLKLLPQTQHKQDERIGDIDMVVTCNMDAPVFCRFLETIGEVILDRAGDNIYFDKGEIYLVRYGDIKKYLEAGPGKYNLEGESNVSIRHAFDGMPFMHRFELSPDTIRYNSRHLAEGAEKYITQNRYGKIFFGHSQNLTPWERIKHIAARINALVIQSHFTDKSDPSSEMVGVTATPNYPIPHGASQERVLVAKTDANLLQQVDADTLAPRRLFDYSDIDHRLNGDLAAAHHQYDPVTGEIFNFTLKLMPPTIQVFVTTRSGEVTILANITQHNGRQIRPAYIHSFWLTKNYVIIPESPLYYNALDFLVSGTAVGGFHWDPLGKTYLHVISRRPDQGHVTTIAVDPFFTFHSANAWDVIEDGEPTVVMDCAAFPDAGIMYHLQSFGNYQRKPEPTYDQKPIRYNGIDVPTKGKSAFGELRRYRLRLQSGESDYQIVIANVEFPRFNQTMAQKPYRFLYCCQLTAASADKYETHSLIKVDLEGKQHYKFEREGYCCSEPIFVPNPAGDKEDDGAVLSLVNIVDRRGPEHDHSILVVLNAKDMSELARCDIGQFTAITFHGSFVDQNFEGVAVN
ncbi:hypothetical protein DFQ28_011571 [Apophysomyces sp. BC1034]|nr:hypothetical protein DFQ29_010135 [Apophysomyces sp. BC1021]KAG0184212.1 hypothetical protein DFQ28_011571 [Apophysomyces sp. BC1034]